MVAKITSGVSVYGALYYNQEKVDKGKARTLAWNRIMERPDGTTGIPECMRSFEAYLAANRRTEKPVIHLSLNPHPDDRLSDGQLEAIGREYMEKLGYGDQPYIIFRHEDNARPHIHIVSLRIDEQGRKIRDYKEWERSMKICRELEQKYRLAPSMKEERKISGAMTAVEYRKGDLKGKALISWKYQQYMRDYLATVLAVDENIGRLLNYLEKTGELDNTIIIYTSDQGFFLGEHGWFDKRFMYEECQRMPLIIRFPKAIKAGSTSNAISMNVDFAPTFLDFAGIEIPSDIQGSSLKPILENEGKTPADWRKAAYYHYYEYPAEHSVKRHYGIRTQDFKLIHFYNDIDEWEMYDMKADPREMNNVFGKPEYAEKQKELMRLLEDTQKQYKDTDPDEKETELFNGDRRLMKNR